MDAQMQELYAAVRLLLRTRYRVKAAEQAHRREQRQVLPRWEGHDRLDELADDLTRARACRQEAEDEVLARWEDFSQDYYATDHSPLTPASQAPVKPDAGWNQYRARVIAAITDAENLLRQHGRSVDDEGMTCEVAPLLGHSIDTLEDFSALHRVVKALRYVARDTLTAVRTKQGGQFALPF